MFGLNKYLLIAAATLAITLVTRIGWLEHKTAKLTAENDRVTASLMSCNARVSNITEDTKSDAQIDEIPDIDLGVVPDHWLRPEG